MTSSWRSRLSTDTASRLSCSDGLGDVLSPFARSIPWSSFVGPLVLSCRAQKSRLSSFCFDMPCRAVWILFRCRHYCDSACSPYGLKSPCRPSVHAGMLVLGAAATPALAKDMRNRRRRWDRSLSPECRGPSPLAHPLSRTSISLSRTRTSWAGRRPLQCVLGTRRHARSLDCNIAAMKNRPRQARHVPMRRAALSCRCKSVRLGARRMRLPNVH